MLPVLLEQDHRQKTGTGPAPGDHMESSGLKCVMIMAVIGAMSRITLKLSFSGAAAPPFGGQPPRSSAFTSLFQAISQGSGHSP
jgi:hypothetical protein